MRLNIFGGLRPFRPREAGRDALAGVTLASMNIPQVLGYTRIAGTPVVTGLYTVLLPLVAFAVFGSSRHLVVAADSATAAIFSSSLSHMATPASEKYMALVGMVALLTAGFLLLARIFKLGFLADFLSRTVLVGFLTGVGFQVGIAMFGDMLGVAAPSRGPRPPRERSGYIRPRQCARRVQPHGARLQSATGAQHPRRQHRRRPVQRFAALHQRPDIRQSPVARDTLVHMVGLGKGISLMSEAIIAMPFPHVAFRPVAGNSDALPFSGVWLLRNSNQALRRFISLARTLSKTWNQTDKSTAGTSGEQTASLKMENPTS